ncbi:MAG TPA: NAD(P)/FAD-dependent oxidoreductase [Thermoleophilaceae bacterium]|nr:NAD(P)/FAD-dependent oxidoreductase [Thermoleophilaceae bacterium]
MIGPAVVVGAGPNGLSAAITLAEAGRDVTVLEAAPRAGGAVATEELTLPGFKHDVFSSVYPAAAASPVFARWPLERHGLRWIHPRACSAHPLPDGRAAVLFRDLAATAESLDALAPGDGQRWREFASPYLRHFGAVRATMLSGFPPLAGPARLLVGLGLGGTLEFARLLFAPASALGRELFAASGSRAWLYGAAMHGDVPPDGAGSAVAAAYLNLLGHAVGWPSPEGGSGRLADALVGHLSTLGGRVTGVEIEGGERVPASIVVADVMPAALLAMCGDSLGGRYAAGLRRYRPGPATLKLDWALDGPIPWENPDVAGAGTVHVGGDEDEVLAATTNLAATLPARPFMLLGQQSVADPTRAPGGKHTAWAYTHGPQHADWAGETERVVDAMEARVESFAPGFRDRILARHVLGPADFQRLNDNLVGGDVGSGSYAIDQVLFRPVPALSPYRTPIRGLTLGSAATFPGGAVHGVPGRAAAGVALAEARLLRR